MGKGSLNSRQIAKLLKRHGFKIVPGKKHGKIVDRNGNYVTAIVISPGKERSKDYMNSVIKACGLDPKIVFTR